MRIKLASILDSSKWNVKKGDYIRKKDNYLDYNDIKKSNAKKKKAVFATIIIAFFVIEIILLQVISKM